jgi:hypothetical protein
LLHKAKTSYIYKWREYYMRSFLVVDDLVHKPFEGCGWII